MSLLLVGCSETTKTDGNKTDIGPIVNDDVISWNDYGAFLGRSENDVTDFDRYKYVSFEFDEFSKSTISGLNAKNINCFAYLNVGSLETYRSYYNDFKSLTFLDYENWNDERWIDITNTNWQNFVVNTLAKSFKDKGATGVYLDNVDVYTIFKENRMNYSKAANALKSIISSLNNLNLKVLLNGGSEFIDDMNDKNDPILNSIWAYHQEEVFSVILNYERNEFGRQNSENSLYYKEIASIMNAKGAEVFFLEYTKDEALIQDIDFYCSEENYHYYCAKTVELL